MVHVTCYLVHVYHSDVRGSSWRLRQDQSVTTELQLNRGLYMSFASGERPLAGRRALITGGNRGIGKAIAFALAEQGCDVAITYNRSVSQAREVIATLRSFAMDCESFPLSMDEDIDYDKFCREVLSSFGPVDILINNAGMDYHGCPVSDTPSEDVWRLMRINAIAPHSLCSAFIPTLRQAARSDIIFISSLVTAMYGPNFAPYGMSKAALEALAFTLAKEERQYNMHVNIVAPGLVDTDMGARFTGNAKGGAAREKIMESLAYGRVCKPEEVASAVSYLVSPGASYINGQRIYVDGGGPLM